jgi:cell division protein FtsN
MGIAVRDDTESSRRSSLAGITYTAIALAFFFGVGLAGGAAYKIYFGGDAGPQIAAQASPPPPLSVQPVVTLQNVAPQNLAPQNLMGVQPGDIEKAGPDLVRIEPSVTPASTPPPAPLVARQPDLPPPTIAAAATPPAAPAEPVPVAAVPPKKPETVAKPRRTASAESKDAETAMLRPPPAAPGNVAGPYRVQFGAFANADNARRVQWAIEATGLKIEITQGAGPSGRPLYLLRSPSYPDYASALSAAQTVQHRVKGFVNAIAIDYTILGDHSVAQQQAQR